MKKNLFIASLFLNATALTACLWLAGRPRPAGSPSVAFRAPPETVFVTNVLAAEVLPPLKLNQTNLKGFVADAKARGLNDPQIRALARSEILSPARQREFWQTRTLHDDLRDGASMEAASAELDRELAAAGLTTRDPYEFVADARVRGRLRDALAPMDEARKALVLKNAGGAWNQDDWDAYQRAFDDSVQVAKKLLSESELLDWEVRQAPPRVEKLQRLPGFEFTGPDEFKAIYRIERDYDKNADTEDLAALAVRRESQLKALLGEERWKAYQRSFQDSSFATEVDLARRHNLPEAYAAWLYDLRQQFYAYERSLKEQVELPEDDRSARLDAAREQYRGFVAQHLPPPALEAYLDSGGFWLKP